MCHMKKAVYSLILYDDDVLRGKGSRVIYIVWAK